MAANRMHVENGIHFITNRCEHEMCLLLPTDVITNIIQCWFAKALAHVCPLKPQPRYTVLSKRIIGPGRAICHMAC